MSKYIYEENDIKNLDIIKGANVTLFKSENYKRMDYLKVNFKNKETILKGIDNISKTITDNVILRINNASYRIVDFEFYIFTESKEFQDPHTHKNKLQLQNGKLYLHGSGIDITFGEDRKRV